MKPHPPSSHGKARRSRKPPRHVLRRERPYAPRMEFLEDRTLLFSPSVQQQITGLALPFLTQNALNALNSAGNLTTAGQLPFADGSFSASSADINANEAAAASGANPSAPAFGLALHEAQDFYSESNWVELGLQGLIDSGSGPWQSLAPYSIHSGAMLVAGTSAQPFGAGSSVSKGSSGILVFNVTTGEMSASGSAISYSGLVTGTTDLAHPMVPAIAVVPQATIAKDNPPGSGSSASAVANYNAAFNRSASSFA